jgi:arsenate reductase (thioredoxin)
VEALRRIRVLFVCLGNSCRSPMAESIAAHIASDVMEVSSAGIVALGVVQSATKQTLAKNGYPADELESKPLGAIDLNSIDIIINMTGRPGLTLFPNPPKVEDWIVEDPYGADAATYQRVFEHIESRVVHLVGKLRTSAADDFAAPKIQEKKSSL